MRAPLLPSLLAAALVASAPAAAQGPDYLYEELRFTSKDGLPSNSVTDLELDEDGSLWVATLGGLARFDGLEFTPVDVETEDGVIARRITSIALLGEERLMIGTQLAGLFLMDGPSVLRIATHQESGRVDQILELPDGTVLIAGTDVLAWSPDAPARCRGLGVRTDARTHLLQDGDAVYAAGASGLWRIAGTDAVRLDGRRFTSLFVAPDGEAYAGTAEGLVPVDDPARLLPVPVGMVYDWAALTPSMTLLAGGERSQGLIATGSPAVPFVLTELEGPERSRAIHVAGGATWIGTSRAGLHFVERSPGFLLGEVDGREIGYAQQVVPLGDRAALVRSGTGLTRLDLPEGASSGPSELTASIVRNDDLRMGQIRGTAARTDGRHWLATSAGLFELSGVDTRRLPISEGPIGGIVRTRSGECWIAEAGAFVEVLDSGDRGRIHPGPAVPPNLLAPFEGGFAFATPSGVFAVDPATGTCTTLTAFDPVVEPRALAARTAEELWLTTYGAGLLRVAGGRSDWFTSPEDLPSDSLGWIDFTEAEDGTETALISSNAGLVVMTLPSAGDQERRGKRPVARLLTQTESEGPTGARLSNGLVLLPTLRGFLGYDSASAPPNRPPPTVLLDSIAVNGEFVDEEPAPFVARADGSANVDLGFAAISMPSSADASISYRLLAAAPEDRAALAAAEAESPWIDSYGARSVQFFNLPPGDYTFQLRGRTPDSDWSVPSTTHIASVRPLLLQRTPVRVAVATAILLALAYVFVRFLKAEEASQELSTAVERSRAEAAQARQLQERYATLLDSSHDGIVLVEADGRISFANEALTRSLGYSRADLLARHASWLGVQDHSQLVSQPTAGAGSQGSIAFRTVVVEDAAGVRRQAELVIARTEVEGRACLLVVVRDLTAHNLLVDKLERTERSFRAIFSGAPAALITFSTDLEVLDRNLRAEDLLAIDAFGRDSLEAAFPEGEPLQQFLQQVAETVATRSEQGAVHLTRLRDGGSHRVHWTTSILGTAPGEVPVLMAVAKDLRAEEAAEARLRKLRRRAAGAEESERSRIAREIHDDISQRLAATTLNAATIRAQVSAGLHSDIAAMVDGLHGDLDSLTADVHALSRQLHPTALDDLGLVRALQSECVLRSSLADLQIEFHGGPIAIDLPGDVALAFFRVAQEAISNAIRHGRPERIDVRLSLFGGWLRLVVSDDGEGFQVEEGDSTGGLGLVSMNERARLIGATLRIEAAPGEGSEVTMEVAVDVEKRGPLAG